MGPRLNTWHQWTILHHLIGFSPELQEKIARRQGQLEFLDDNFGTICVRPSHYLHLHLAREFLTMRTQQTCEHVSVHALRVCNEKRRSDIPGMISTCAIRIRYCSIAMS